MATKCCRSLICKSSDWKQALSRKACGRKFSNKKDGLEVGQRSKQSSISPMHAWCLTLAKQTCQTLPSLRKAATQQLVRGVADGKHPPQAWLSSSHAAASLYSQVKPEHAWHGKIAAQLRRYSQQATTSTLGIKRMPKQSSITVKQPPHLSQKAIHIRHAHFRSLHCPASGLAQSIMTLQKKPLPMLLQWPGKVPLQDMTLRELLHV